VGTRIKAKVTKLSDIISDSELYDFYQKQLNSFSCKNSDVEEFLLNKAVSFEQRGKSCSYIIYDSNNGDIIAYFTLSLKAVQFSKNEVSKTTIKDIDGFSKDVDSMATVLIGQFGKNQNRNKAISGKELLQVAIDIIHNVKSMVGGRICLLETEDTEDNQKVIEFYINNGFKVLQHDKNDKFLQMFRKL